MVTSNDIIGKSKWFARHSAEKLAKNERIEAKSSVQLVELLSQGIAVDRVIVAPAMYDAPRKVSQYGPYFQLTASGNPYETRMGMLTSQRNRLNDYMGFCWVPKHGLDRRSRVISTDSILEGISLFAYAMQTKQPSTTQELNNGLELVDGTYQGRRHEDGSHYLVKVPSRQNKEGRYNIMFHNVGKLKSSGEIGWNLDKEGDIAEVTRHREALGYSPALAGSVFFSEHHVAGYALIIKHQNAIATKNNKSHALENTPALVANPFPLPSKKAMHLYDMARHHTLMQEPDGKLRLMHEAEISNLLMTAAKMHGPDEILTWNPKRDGSLSSYRPPRYITG